MTYREVLEVVETRPDAVTAFIPVTNEDGEDGIFWGTFSMMYQGDELTQRLAADAPGQVRLTAAVIAAVHVRKEARERGLVVR